VLEAEVGGAGERELVEQRLGEAVVVIAGDEDDLSPGQRLAELPEERAGAGEGDAERQVAQLDRVAEQDEAVGAGDLLEEGSAHARLAQHVVPAGTAEVEVGDDRRPHPFLLSGRVALLSPAGLQKRHAHDWLPSQSLGRLLRCPR